MSTLKSLPVEAWNVDDPSLRDQAIQSLETGHVVFFPALPFTLTEKEHFLLTPTCTDPMAKNVSWNANQQSLKGTTFEGEQREVLQAMMERFCDKAQRLVGSLLPQYKDAISLAKTSYRPVEVQGRRTSFRKDDTRLHVDAFPSNPVQDKRILRVFSNVNPSADRVWRAGEPFENVAKYFKQKLTKPFPGSTTLLKLLGITKSQRSLYDHYMLQLHHTMKADMDYQTHVQQETLHLPPNSTWMVFTDQVSHAAVKGQYLLEQSFYLPVSAMQDPERSPQRVLERVMG